MNAKIAKLLRKRIKEAFHVGSIGRGVHAEITKKQIKDADGAVVGVRIQTVLDIKCPRAIYQRTKRNIHGKSRRRSFTRQRANDGRVVRVATDDAAAAQQLRVSNP